MSCFVIPLAGLQSDRYKAARSSTQHVAVADHWTVISVTSQKGQAVLPASKFLLTFRPVFLHKN